MQRWITDTEPSARFPLYTRANAGEVLPEPVSPLAWSLVWEPGVVMGWADTQVSVGTFDREDMDPVLPEVVGCFGGYLYINAAMARMRCCPIPSTPWPGRSGHRCSCPRPPSWSTSARRSATP